jgi:hypothetical protein
VTYSGMGCGYEVRCWLGEEGIESGLRIYTSPKDFPHCAMTQ